MATEKRLIDANELTDRLSHTTMVAYPNLFPGLLAAVEVVDDSPTVDAVEVVHGSWAFIAEDCCVCSVCHKHSIVDYHYCPECGAKMDLEGE